MNTIIRVLTFAYFFVIMVSYMMIKFTLHPLACIKAMRDNWRMVNGDYKSTHSKTEEKETKR